MIGGGSLLGLPSVHPILDGATPVFWQTGADPSVSPGLDLPIKSVAKFGALYFEKWGPQATDWSQVEEPSAGGVAFADFMRGPNTTGTIGFTTASPAGNQDFGGTILHPVGHGGTGSVNLNTGAAVNAIQVSMVQNIVTVPMILPAGLIRYFTINLTAAPVATANPFVRMGVWASRLTADRFKYSPGELLYDSGAIDVKGATVGTLRAFNTEEVAITIPSPGVYHFGMVATADAALQQIGACTQSAIARFLGMTAKWGNGQPNYNDSYLIGHATALIWVPPTMPTLPDPFVSVTADYKWIYYKGTGGTVDIPQFLIGMDPA